MSRPSVLRPVFILLFAVTLAVVSVGPLVPAETRAQGVTQELLLDEPSRAPAVSLPGDLRALLPAEPDILVAAPSLDDIDALLAEISRTFDQDLDSVDELLANAPPGLADLIDRTRPLAVGGTVSPGPMDPRFVVVLPSTDVGALVEQASGMGMTARESGGYVSLSPRPPDQPPGLDPALAADLPRGRIALRVAADRLARRWMGVLDLDQLMDGLADDGTDESLEEYRGMQRASLDWLRALIEALQGLDVGLDLVGGVATVNYRLSVDPDRQVDVLDPSAAEGLRERLRGWNVDAPLQFATAFDMAGLGRRFGPLMEEIWLEQFREGRDGAVDEELMRTWMELQYELPDGRQIGYMRMGGDAPEYLTWVGTHDAGRYLEALDSITALFGPGVVREPLDRDTLGGRPYRGARMDFDWEAVLERGDADPEDTAEGRAVLEAFFPDGILTHALAVEDHGVMVGVGPDPDAFLGRVTAVERGIDFPATLPADARDAEDDLAYWTAVDVPPLVAAVLDRLREHGDPETHARMVDAVAATPHARFDAYGLVGPGRYTGRWVMDLEGLSRFVEAMEDGAGDESGDDEGY